MDFLQLEDRDGLRFSWNVWPLTKNEAARTVLPLGCNYSPYKKVNPPVNYEPVMCKGSCHTILSPYCPVDFQNRVWTCPFCFTRNAIPPQYSAVSEQNLPAELISNYTTIEYQLPRATSRPPTFLFLVDLTVTPSEFTHLKEALQLAVSLIPENCFVGLITFGTNVFVHELSHEICPKSFVFNGHGADLNPKKIQQLLNIASGGTGNQALAHRFISELSECQLNLTSILDDLQIDPHSPKKGDRPHLCTGTALNVAISLLESACPNSPARILTFVNGPCTHGLGAIVGLPFKELIRSRMDLSSGSAKYTSKAAKYYLELAERAARNGHVVDIYSTSLDQIGILEMHPLFQKTGGVCVMADGVDSPIFSESLRTFFESDDEGLLKNGMNACLLAYTSRELKINGVIGHCVSLDKKAPHVSESEVGVGGTYAWKIGSIDPTSTLSFCFEVVNQNPVFQAGQRGFLQFQTHYQNSRGQQILRVTTVGCPWADPNSGLSQVAVGFDQEAAASLMAKIAAFKSLSQDSGDVMRWLDQVLIRLCNRFGSFLKDDPNSFQLAPNFSLYPQFMFHLRRSPLLQTFNASPDETCYMRMVTIRQITPDVLLIMQPYMEAYIMGKEPTPVLLSASSLLADRVLLLDTFFNLVVWKGSSIVEWTERKLHEQPEYAHLKDILEKPNIYVDFIKKTRFPYPRLVDAEAGKGEARYVTSVVDPNVTQSSSYGASGGEMIMTDDVNLDVFLAYLKRLAVQPQ